MHIYRRKARNLAWYDQEGEPSTHNPFKKFRSRPRRSSSIKLESRLAPVRTAGDVPLFEERRRRQSMTDGLQGPEHSDSFPPESSLSRASEGHTRPNTASVSRAESSGGVEGPDLSMHSREPINVSFQDEQEERDLEGGPRKRKSLLGKWRNHGEGNGDETASASTADGDPEDKEEDKQKFTLVGQLKATVFNSWMNIFILAAPVGIALSQVKGIDPVVVFVVNFIAIIPLAAMLGYATEEVAMRTGETIGGLLNATFGNAVELIVAIIALAKDEIVIVQTSLVGSMLSNLLLVMGMCFFFGGLNRLEQHFNPVVAQTAASLLALAVGSLIIPTAFHQWSEAGTKNVAALSRGTSIMLLVVYGCYLFFQLRTHTEIYNKPSPKVEKRRVKIAEGDASRGIAQIGKMSASMAGQNVHQIKLQNPDDEEEEPQLHLIVAFVTLGISTALVAVCAEFMVDSINALVREHPISETFVGLILLPIVGNAAEHATAVTVACKDKMDLAIGVAVGSSMQIALLVLPLIIVIGWIKGNEDMTLYFDGFQVILLFVSVLLVNYLIADGKSHWLEGVLLMMMYLIIALASWYVLSNK
ncbi:hydrogen/calcium exchanger domain-containing protein [Aspergillus ruber CBS 135680]|uniref:Sodium/calcium transporter n=1 Tax=Aspergillus ruber (strain CBS 135680) TaxID=1388766 RepID=A0A017SAU2_ASPRC|nr:sodium/calcium transporter [Aspergillus ruber CBS 135680]EYE93941.1 sodium/calcium transporter [Aspergillus ruber CBS 135680]